MFVCYLLENFGFSADVITVRYGRRSQSKKGRGENKEAEPDSGVLPLLDHDEDDSAYARRRRKKRRAFRVASRCQVSTTDSLS